MQIIAENISYTSPSGKNVLHDISLSLHKGEKAALAGDNGSGKSTFLRILSGELPHHTGSVQFTGRHWMIPQHFGQYDSCTIAQVLQVQEKTDALHEIENGSVDPGHFETIAGDWSIHGSLQSALEKWNLTGLSHNTPFKSLSGGEKTRLFLAGIDIHHPTLILMDEPTNHLDRSGREMLCHMVVESVYGFLIVSHDRELLNLCNPVYELSPLGIKRYGGNYDFYEEQKQIELDALDQHMSNTRQAISDARRKHRDTMERKQKMNARGKKKAKKMGLGKMAINTARNRAEGSTSRMNEMHEQKVAKEKEHLAELRRQQSVMKQIRFSVNHSPLHTGKTLFEADRINYAWPDSDPLWQKSLRFVIQSGDRIRVTGCNGSGKSTLLRLLKGELKPSSGSLRIQSEHRFLLDQECSLIDREATVLEQAARSNQVKKPAHELRTLLHRYLFEKKMWNQQCGSLSGGEMMRLSLCGLALQADQPDTLLLDEPTNNLDLRNIKLLTEAVSSYRGTLILVSHDTRFVEEVDINKEIKME